MKGLAFWFVFTGSLLALVGMVWGITMSISMDHTLASAHAHNNLVGYVTMVLYGLYYAKVPSAAKTLLARIHFWVALVAALTMGLGVAMAISQKGEMLAQIASLATLAGMVLFAINIFIHRKALMD